MKGGCLVLPWSCTSKVLSRGWMRTEPSDQQLGTRASHRSSLRAGTGAAGGHTARGHQHVPLRAILCQELPAAACASDLKHKVCAGLKIHDPSTFWFSLLIINPQDLQVPSE